MRKLIVIGFCLAIFFSFVACDQLNLGLRPDGTAVISAAETNASQQGLTPPLIANGSPGWWAIYFTDPANHGDSRYPAGSIEEKLIDQINHSQQSIDTASFEFDIPAVADALIAARQRGVLVRWLTDVVNGIQADQNGQNLFPRLVKNNIEVKANQPKGLMHNKFWIFDRKVVWTGSTNISKSGIFQNNSNVIVISSTKLADIYSRQFEDMWAGKIGLNAPSDIAAQHLIIENTPIQVLFSPEDNAMSYILQTVSAARKSIRFMAYSFTDNNLAKVMINEAKKGVSVSGIFETRGSELSTSELKTLFCASLPVRQDGNPSLFHHKVIIVDDHIVITGSFNFSASANKINSENVLIIDDSQMAAAYLQEFENRWIEAKKPDLTCR